MMRLAFLERDRFRCHIICKNLAPTLLVLSLLSGCAIHKRDKRWDNSFSYLDYVSNHLPKDASGKGWVKEYYDAVQNQDPDDELRDKRNRVVNGYLLLADVAYSKFEDGYNKEIAQFEIGSDLVNLGLTAAAAVTPPAALLGAAATGTLGVKHSVEKNVLNSQTRFVIENRMSAIREKKRIEILQRELKPVVCGPPPPVGGVSAGQQSTVVSDVCYTLEDALRDVQDYFYLGSIHRALASIDAETGKIAENAAKSVSLPSKPVFTSENHVTFTVGTPGGPFAVTVTGSPTPTLTYTGALPNGVNFDAATGMLRGTPAAGTAGMYPIRITARNGVGGDVLQDFNLTVN